jgi:hypothetical protein
MDGWMDGCLTLLHCQQTGRRGKQALACAKVYDMLSCPSVQVLAQEEELLGVVEDFRRFAGLDGSGQAGIRQAVHALASAQLAALLRAADHHGPTHTAQTKFKRWISRCRCADVGRLCSSCSTRSGGLAACCGGCWRQEFWWRLRPA